MYDYLWKDGIILSTFHGTRVYHAVSLYGLFGSHHYTKTEAFPLVNPIDKFPKAWLQQGFNSSVERGVDP